MLNLNDNTLRFIAAAGFFIAWMVLVSFKIPNADSLIDFCQKGLGAVGVYHLAVNRAQAPIPPSTP